MNHPLRIAVTGMHRGDNPQPGSSIVSAIRQCWPDAFIVGLVYNAYESGIYAAEGPDVCHTMPYPTAGPSIYLQRLQEACSLTPFDFLIPTLDTEIMLLAGLTGTLKTHGIKTVLPDPETLERCGKVKLHELAENCSIGIPETIIARDMREALSQAESLGYPLFIKGRFYDAALVAGPDALSAKAAAILADWGPPLLLQKPVRGSEINVLGIGDGEGGIAGSCAVRKLIISDKGKGNGSIVIRDSRLDDITRRIMMETRWLGPFELEFIRDDSDDSYRLIEINPRFPAWVGFPAGLGANYPAAWMRYLIDGILPPLPDLEPGNFFIRHQIEVCGDVERLSLLLDNDRAVPSNSSHPHPNAS